MPEREMVASAGAPVPLVDVRDAGVVFATRIEIVPSGRVAASVTIWRLVDVAVSCVLPDGNALSSVLTIQ